jgi:hypothetical protein
MSASTSSGSEPKGENEPAVQEESDYQRSVRGAAMYPAFECSRLAAGPDPLIGPKQNHALFLCHFTFGLGQDGRQSILLRSDEVIE